MKGLAALLLASMLAVLLTACGAEPTQTGGVTGDQGPAGRADAALDQALGDLVAMSGGPPGVIAVVQRDDDRKVHAFGVADLESGSRIGGDDHMRVASAAKAFSGAAALSLVSEGTLSLDDTIGERLPELPEAWSGVTLRHLLNHTSGLPDFSRAPAFQDALMASLTEAPPPEELLSFVEDEPLEFEPGAEYRYSNSDNVAVALMIESATGDAYEEQLASLVYEPLGLEGTSLPSGTNLETPFIHGYDNDPSQNPPEDYSETVAAGWAWASGGIVSTPADLNDFIRGYAKGELFDARTQAQQRRVFEGGGPSRPARERTRPDWESSATRRGAGRYGATRATR